MKNYLLIITAIVMCAFTFTKAEAGCQPVDVAYLQSGSSDFGEMTTDATNVWSWDATYNCAKATRSGGVEGHLFTPILDLSGVDAVTVKFAHTHKFAGTPSEELTLWVTADYKGDYASSSWEQLTISPYGTNTNWTFVDVTIDVPVSLVGEKTVFCFKYISTASNYATWELKKLQIASTCPVIECNAVNASYLLNGASGLGDVTTDATDVWAWDASYSCAKARKQGGGEGHLLTPALDLAGSDEVTLKFSHTHKYGTDLTTEFTLWVTDDYKGDYASSTWRQLTIDPYASNNDWKFVDVSIDVPTSYVGEQTVFCFKYVSTASNNGTWEVKNINIANNCPNGGSVAPVPLPEIGDGRLKVCGQNLLNYYFNTNTGRGNYTAEELAAKTHKITDAMLWVDADIYAFCELEAQDIILRQLVDSLNKFTASTNYSYVVDDINVTWDADHDNNLKSGFVYRNDKVKTIGSNTTVYNASSYYGKTMRVQTFEELSSGERFTLSMNHFKSKAGSAEDQGNSTRVENATRLIENISSKALDKDILILGDLNCEVGEEPLTLIENAGYEEQLLKYDESAYSYCYKGNGSLIDHVYANSTMAEQITGAGVFHISTTCESANYNHSYSDHDPYVVGINLASVHATECEETEYAYLPTGASDMGEMKTEKLKDSKYYWRYQASYGATCQDKGGEDWLLTPILDLSQAGSVTLKFDHTINKANNMSEQQTLWVTPDFSSVSESQWTQLTIPNYPSGTNWNFVSTTVSVPMDKLGRNTVFGFKYDVPADAASEPTWEIKNLKITVSCDVDPQAIENVSQSETLASKLISNGHLYIVLPDGTRYNIIGVKVQ